MLHTWIKLQYYTEFVKNKLDTTKRDKFCAHLHWENELCRLVDSCNHFLILFKNFHTFLTVLNLNKNSLPAKFDILHQWWDVSFSIRFETTDSYVQQQWKLTNLWGGGGVKRM